MNNEIPRISDPAPAEVSTEYRDGLNLTMSNRRWGMMTRIRSRRLGETLDQEGRWYDEIRYDSHERKRGGKIPVPHLHVKLQSGLKGGVICGDDVVRADFACRRLTFAYVEHVIQF